jgi:hypothetical protein
VVADHQGCEYQAGMTVFPKHHCRALVTRGSDSPDRPP